MATTRLMSFLLNVCIFLYFDFKCIEHWIDCVDGVFVPGNYLLDLLLYVFDCWWIFVFIEGQDGLVGLLTHFVLTKNLNHFVQYLFDCSLIILHFWESLAHHVSEIIDWLVRLTLLWFQEQLVGVAKSAEVLAESLANLSGKNLGIWLGT